MTVVKKNRQPVTDHRIKRYGCFEQLLLNVAGQFRPEPKGCITQQSFELSEVIAHFLFPIPISRATGSQYEPVITSGFRPEPLCFVFNLRQIPDPHQTVLAGECQGLVGALGLRNAEYTMIACIVYLDTPAILDH